MKIRNLITTLFKANQVEYYQLHVIVLKICEMIKLEIYMKRIHLLKEKWKNLRTSGHNKATEGGN